MLSLSSTQSLWHRHHTQICPYNCLIHETWVTPYCWRRKLTFLVSLWYSSQSELHIPLHLSLSSILYFQWLFAFPRQVRFGTTSALLIMLSVGLCLSCLLQEWLLSLQASAQKSLLCRAMYTDHSSPSSPATLPGSLLPVCCCVSRR